jgi:hypothetical protein
MKVPAAVCFLVVLGGCQRAQEPVGPDPCLNIAFEAPAADGVTDEQVAIARKAITYRTKLYKEHPELGEVQACKQGSIAVGGVPPAERNGTPPKSAPKSKLTDAEIDRMTTYVTGIGRAIGCGFPVDDETATLATWLNTHVPNASARAAYTRIATTGAATNAQMQAAGNSPDTCEDVRRELPLMTLR